MPNHGQGLSIIGDNGEIPAAGTQHAEPLRSPMVIQQNIVGPGSLGALVRSFRSAVTSQVNILNGTPGTSFWQRSYYEHIIRDERSLDAIRRCIASNPAA